MSKTTWFRLWPFFVSVNEGGYPVNFSFGWLVGKFHWYFCVRVFGKPYRWHV
jgi:hypothetical protein